MGAQKCKTVILGVKSLRWKKGLTIRAKVIGGGNPFYLKFWIKLTTLERNCRFSIYFCS